MRVLVTGNLGYLGSVATSMLHENNHDVLGIDMDICAIYPEHEYDIRVIDWDKYLPYVDAVVHLAGVSNDPACELDDSLTYDINNAATIVLIEAVNRCPNIKKFVFASSASVYGSSEEVSTESSRLSPISAYALSKRMGEQRILGYLDGRIRPTILRLGTLFGKSIYRQRFDLAINLMVKDAVLNNEIKVYGGDQWRPFLHVNDAASAILFALTDNRIVDSSIYNVAISNIKISDLAVLIKNRLDSMGYHGININTFSLDDQRNYRLDCSLIKSIGFDPLHTIDMGIWEMSLLIKDMVTGGYNLEDSRYYTIKLWKKWVEKYGTNPVL